MTSLRGLGSDRKRFPFPLGAENMRSRWPRLARAGAARGSIADSSLMWIASGFADDSPITLAGISQSDVRVEMPARVAPGAMTPDIRQRLGNF